MVPSDDWAGRRAKPVESGCTDTPNLSAESLYRHGGRAEDQIPWPYVPRLAWHPTLEMRCVMRTESAGMELRAQRPLGAHVDPRASSSAATSDSAVPQDDAATDGKWTIGGGSIAGFRCQVSVLGRMTSIVGHSTALTGSIDVAGGSVAAGSFRIDLATVQIFGKSNAGLNRMIDTTRYPAVTFILNRAISLNTSPLTNVTYRAPAIGSLTMHGKTRPVTFTFAARYTGTALEATGSIALAFSDWGLKAPFGIRDTGSIDFTLRMRRAPRRFPTLRSLSTEIPRSVQWSSMDS